MTRRYGRYGKKRAYSAVMGGRDALLLLLDQLHASYHVYREGHWTVQGNDYYGNHLLLERIYTETEKEIDGLAEMLVGSYGSDVIARHHDGASKWTESFKNPEHPMKGALKAAQTVRATIDLARDALKQSGEWTTGWDELLMALAKEKDHHLYFLQQATAHKPNSSTGFKLSRQGAPDTRLKHGLLKR